MEAFKAGDKTKILEESDTLARLVADLHNPLALTDNADGQKTGQHGLWLRFSEKLPEAMETRLKLNPDAARYLDDPEGVRLLDDQRDLRVARQRALRRGAGASAGKAGYTEIYYEDLAQRVGADPAATRSRRGRGGRRAATGTRRGRRPGGRS